MTDPIPLEDMTDTDELVRRTDNGPHEGDPDEQPPQDPTWLPEGTDTGRQDSGR
jgi:hypothetical protein